MSDEEPPYDERELEEAERLAALLERRPASARGVEDAVDAADMVSVLREPLLSAAREDAVLDTALAAIAQQKKKTRFQILAVSGAGVAALAAVALLTFVRPSAPSQEAVAARTRASAASPRAASAPAADEAPPPPPSSAELRAAQRAWLDAPIPAQRRALDQALERHREALFASVEGRYLR